MLTRFEWSVTWAYCTMQPIGHTECDCHAVVSGTPCYELVGHRALGDSCDWHMELLYAGLQSRSKDVFIPLIDLAQGKNWRGRVVGVGPPLENR